MNLRPSFLNLDSLVGKMLGRYSYSGFPVVSGSDLVGYASREKLQGILGKELSCEFS
jgi:chloride channel 3/4/5